MVRKARFGTIRWSLPLAVVMLAIGAAYAAMLSSSLSDLVNVSDIIKIAVFHHKTLTLTDSAGVADSVSTSASSPPPVGGQIIPINKLGLLAPYVGMAAIIVVAATLALVYSRRSESRNQR